MDYFELGIIDTSAIFVAGHAFAASWYTFCQVWLHLRREVLLRL